MELGWEGPGLRGTCGYLVTCLGPLRGALSVRSPGFLENQGLQPGMEMEKKDPVLFFRISPAHI